MAITLSALLGSIAPIGATGVTGATGVGLTTNANGDILPASANVSNIGSANNKFNSLYTKSLFLDANTLYVDGVPVLSSSANNISFSADPNQGLRFTTTGTGNVVLTSNAGTTIQTTGQNGDVVVQSSGQGGLTRVTSATQVTLTAPTVAVVGNQTVSANLSVSGNFTVAGNVTSVDSTITNIKDNIITLNKGEIGSGVTLNVSGIEVDRGDLARQRLIWNEAAGKWTAGPTSSEVALATETFVNTGLNNKANTDLSNVGTLPDAVINQIRGYAGATGVQGASGSAGANGASGSAGPTGATGVGIDGASGFVGSNGATGPAGVNGATGTIGSIQNWSIKTTTYTAVSKDSIAANTSGGAFTITLPATPSSGDFINIADSGHSFDTNNLTIARNGSTIELLAEDLVADVANIFITLIYDGTTWRVFTTAGTEGATGATGSQGVQGASGSIGATGAGLIGATGSAGTNGATGSAGTNGATGSAGTNGATGTGVQGASGSAGTNGATGSVGATGVGVTGATGPTGATGAGTAGATGTIGSIQNWIIKTTTYTAVNKDSIAADTSAGAFTITLPATPSTGDFINIADSGHTFSTNNLTLGRNGSTIESEAANFIIDVSNVFVSLIYDGTTWKVFSTVGVQGVQGASGPASINQFLLMGA
jgi:hypothetical protein